ncbi:MAG: hypothetical protein U0736_11745 [Gemmataceae bacterium]
METLEDRTAFAVDLLSGGSVGGTLGYNGGPAVSANGRYVVFQRQSADRNHGVIDDNGTGDIFLCDRLAGTTTLVSHAASSTAMTATGNSFNPTISADGRFVLFLSLAADLVANERCQPKRPTCFSGTVSVTRRDWSVTVPARRSSPWWVAPPRPPRRRR